MSALRLYFTGNAENFHGDLYIDYAVFTDPEGNEIHLDREETYGECKDGILKMQWRNCFDAQDDMNNLIFDDGYMTLLAFDHFVLEDEAPLDYDLQCISWSYECY